MRYRVLQRYILLEARLEALEKATKFEYEVEERFKGDTLKDKTYLPLFPYYAEVAVLVVVSWFGCLHLGSDFCSDEEQRGVPGAVRRLRHGRFGHGRRPPGALLRRGRLPRLSGGRRHPARPGHDLPRRRQRPLPPARRRLCRPVRQGRHRPPLVPLSISPSLSLFFVYNCKIRFA